MIRYWAPIVFALSLLGHGVHAQYWAPANLPIEVDIQLRQFHWEMEFQTFYVVGRTRVPAGSQDLHRVGILRHQNNDWDTLGLFSSDVYSVAHFGDTLFVSGGFTSVNGLSHPGHVAVWYGGTWHPDPQFVHWSHGGLFRKLNGVVYVLGNFQDSLGQSIHGVGIRQGGQWVLVGNLPPTSEGGGHQLFDIVEYNGQLVVTGNINTDIGDDVFILEGNDWVPLGGGLLGWNSFGRRLVVYQDDLYLGGGIFMSQGDTGQNILRWDGNQWHPVGQGLQLNLGENGQNGAVYDMLVHDGELFVCGGFSYAGGIPARGVARWNGEQWCSVGGAPESIVFCMGFFQDTLYINNPGTFDGQDFNYVAKFVAPEYENICGLWAGMEEDLAPVTFTLHPNPTTGLLYVALNGLRPREVFVTDAVGRTVLQQVLSRTTQGPLQLDLGIVSPGVYLVTLLDAEGMRHTQRVVKE